MGGTASKAVFMPLWSHAPVLFETRHYEFLRQTPMGLSAVRIHFTHKDCGAGSSRALRPGIVVADA